MEFSEYCLVGFLSIIISFVTGGIAALLSWVVMAAYPWYFFGPSQVQSIQSISFLVGFVIALPFACVVVAKEL